MKRISILWLLYLLYSTAQAQLTYRKIWEKKGQSYESTLFYNFALPIVQQLPKNKFMYSAIYGGCFQCSLSTLNNIFIKDTAHIGKYILQDGKGLPLNRYILSMSTIDERKHSILYNEKFDSLAILPISSSYGWAFNSLSFTNKNESYVWKTDSLCTITKDGYIKNKIPINITRYATDGFVAQCTTNVESKTFLNIYDRLKTSYKLILIDTLGKRQWEYGPIHEIIGFDNKSNCLVSLMDSTIATIDLTGKEIERKPIVKPIQPIGKRFLKTADNEYILWNNFSIGYFDNKGDLKYDTRAGQLMPYKPKYYHKYREYPNGNIMFYGTGVYGIKGVVLFNAMGEVLVEMPLNSYVERADGWFIIEGGYSIIAINPQGEIAWKKQFKIKGDEVSELNVTLDKDNNLLVTDTYGAQTHEPGGYAYWLDDSKWNNKHHIYKYDINGKLLWQVPIEFTIEEMNGKSNRLAGILPSDDGKNYILLFERLKVISSYMGSIENYFLKITRPCHSKVDAALKSSTQILCPNQVLQLTANADSLNFLTYQWQRDGQPIATTTKEVFQTNLAGTYRVVVSDTVCQTSATSAEIKVIARAAPQATVNIVGATDFCQGETGTSLSTTQTNAEWKYQWLYNGTPNIGMFQTSIIPTLSGVYALSVRDSICGTQTTSTPVTVRIRPLPDATIKIETQGIVYAPFTVKLSANTAKELNYQWLKEGKEIKGATLSTYEVAESGNYTVKITQENCSRTSQSVSVTILQPLAVAPTQSTDIIIFPNPNSDGEFKVSVSNKWVGAKWEIYDMNGRVISYIHTQNGLRLIVPNGIYWLKMKKDNQEIVRRLIMNK